ncbi:MAG: PKD domain-containing protein [Bacteroidota bacterium]
MKHTVSSFHPPYLKHLLLMLVSGLILHTTYAQTLTVNILADTATNCLGSGGVLLSTTITGGMPPYTIDWGPGTTLNDSTIEDPIANPSVPVDYVIVVTDALLATAIDSISVDTASTPTSSFDWVDTVCSASFAPPPIYTGNFGTAALFNWQLNNGQIVSSSSPVYPAAIDVTVPGPYILCLWVEENGCVSDTSCQTLLSAQPPLISISPIFDQCFPANQFSFSLIDSSGLDSIIWDLGSTASIQNSNAFVPSGIQYLTPGQKTISAIGFQAGCPTDTAIQSFWVSHPQVSISADTLVCTGDTVSFSAIDASLPGTAGGFLSWQWFFSTGASFQGQSITEVFSTPGVYSVVLQVSDSFGCTATDSLDIVVTQAPTGSFSYTIDNCNEVSFSNTFSTGSFQWDFGDGTGDTASNPVHIYTAPAVYFVMLTVSSNCQTIIVPQSLTILPNCVWPGDANNDLVADNVDVLAIGVAYGDTGPVRTNASLLWEGQPADDWADTLANGVNTSYVDTDGNGTVNDDDTLAILTNYGLTHNKTEDLSGVGPVLYFDSSSIAGPVMVGNSFSIPIMLGTPSEPATDVYGIAFTLTYESHLIDSASAKFSVSNSWFGSNLLRIEKDFYVDGELDGAICRKNKTNTSNQGKIAGASFVMIDDIAKQFLYDTLTLGFKDVVLIQADGTQIPVTTLPTKIVVFQEDIINAYDSGLRPEQLWLYPNPASSMLSLRLLDPIQYDATLSDLNGKLILRKEGILRETRLDISKLSKGVYLLKITHPKGILTRKVFVQ